jgi:hypothetical protein
VNVIGCLVWLPTPKFDLKPVTPQHHTHNSFLTRQFLVAAFDLKKARGSIALPLTREVWGVGCSFFFSIVLFRSLPSRKRSAAWIGCVTLFANAVNEMINIAGLYCYVSMYVNIVIPIYYSPEHCYTKTQLWNAENCVSHSAPKTQCVHLNQSRDFNVASVCFLNLVLSFLPIIWFLCITVRWLWDDAWDGLSLNSGI